MSDQGWIISGLVSVVLLLIGVLGAAMGRRLDALEVRGTAHDQWAGDRQTENSSRSTALETSVQNILFRFDRLDGRLDRIEQLANRDRTRGSNDRG